MIYVIVIALVFLLCFLVDKGFTKLFRSKPQHKSGLSIRLSKYYGVGGLVLCVLAVAAFFAGFTAVMQEGLGSFTSEYEVYQNGNIYTYGTQENSLVFRTKGSVTVKRLSVTS